MNSFAQAVANVRARYGLGPSQPNITPVSSPYYCIVGDVYGEGEICWWCGRSRDAAHHPLQPIPRIKNPG